MIVSPQFYAGSAKNVAPVTPSNRIVGLDFTKGALVLIMVLYHWTNYFVAFDDSTFRYLRFLTPSFIFITGFLIAQVYLPKSSRPDARIPERMAVRGCKLLGIALFLNLALSGMQGSIQTRTTVQSPEELALAFFVGTAPVAFAILVPIAYLLLVSAGLFVVHRMVPPIFHVVSIALSLSALICEWQHLGSGHLETLSIGMLGVSAGHISMQNIQRLLQHPVLTLAAYGAYAYAIAVWNAVYLLQIVGVCLNVAVLFWLGEAGQSTSLARLLARLGGYSLFAYIAQIAILRVLRTGLRPLGSSMAVSLLALVLGIVCTVLSVELVERARRGNLRVNQWYGAVFS
jgi:uncharacterized membrane protein